MNALRFQFKNYSPENSLEVWEQSLKILNGIFLSSIEHNSFKALLITSPVPYKIELLSQEENIFQLFIWGEGVAGFVWLWEREVREIMASDSVYKVQQ